MNHFDEQKFRSRLNKATEEVKKILDITRNPQAPESVAHNYDDKYFLAELLTNSAIAGALSALEAVGVEAKAVGKLQEWVKEKSSVTLRLRAEESCTFIREASRKVESSSAYVVEHQSGASKSTTTHKVVTTINEWFWQFVFNWQLVIFRGNKSDEAIVLNGRSGECELITTSKDSPRPSSVVRPSLDVNITWLIQNSENAQSKFSIDRARKSCHTPRRNDDIESAFTFFERLFEWCGSVRNYFLNNLFPVQDNSNLDLTQINANSLFNPIVPLFERISDSNQRTVALVEDLDNFIREQRSHIGDKLANLTRIFKTDTRIVSNVETFLIVIALHLRDVAEAHLNSIEYIEHLIRKQLIAAIGKIVQPSDFANYMKFHNRRLFKTEYQVAPLSYAIRRPEHSPEGEFTIELCLTNGETPQPVPSLVNQYKSGKPMQFRLNASTVVSMNAERYLHAFVDHQFSGESGSSLRMIARARQFSSFILLVGKMLSGDLFDPKYGIVIQNKDDLRIPLILETIPSAKEFQDSIESLSEEQQRFCQAYRAMQLSGTLFAVAVIQIKPQLESLLNLKSDSLTKEIKLTQELQRLFLEYQIPADLLSYSGPANAHPQDKLNAVKLCVKQMFDMIDDCKRQEIEEKRKADETVKLEKKSKSKSLLSSVQFRRSSVRSKSKSASVEKKSVRKDVEKEKVKEKKEVKQSEPEPVPEPSPEPAPEADVPETPDAKESAESRKRAAEDEFDVTAIPSKLDQKLCVLDEDGALRPTTIEVDSSWQKTSQAALLSGPVNSSLGLTQHRAEKNKAFDLLDALTKSGCLDIVQAEFHIVIASTHCFDKTLLDTVVQDNVNPIEKVERSVLIVASTIFDKPVEQLIRPEQLERVRTYSPQLFQ